MTLISVGRSSPTTSAGRRPAAADDHGAHGTYAHWGEPFLEQLRGDFELILYDHRGIGASTACKARHDSPDGRGRGGAAPRVEFDFGTCSGLDGQQTPRTSRSPSRS